MVPEILAGIQALRSVLQAGMAARDAWKEEGFGKDEVSTLSALHNAAEGLWKLKPQQEEGLGTLHLATVARCFGHTIRRHQEHSEALSTQPQALFQNVAEVEQPPQLSAKEIDRVLGSAAQVHIALGALPVEKLEIDLVESLTGSPLNTPYYRFLWDAFFKPAEGEPPLLKLEAGGVLEFERAFVLAWGEAMASTTGERLRLYLEGLQQDYKPQLIQEVLISDMAAWGSRHTFGNLTRDEPGDGDPLPFMPLELMYVEPLARDAGDRQESGRRVLERLEQVLQTHRIVIIQADFGMGKSLTSRMLACLRARKLRDASVPSADLELPIHIRCADDLRSNDLSLLGAVQRARQRQAETLGYSLSTEDKALAFPPSQQRTLFLLDGLDEVHLGETGLKTFFDNIKDKARGSERHRFVIFSRPGAIPSSRDVRTLEDIPLLELLPWNREQVDEWLRRWRQVNEGRGPTREELDGQGLGTLAPTPILLLMMAQTWDPTTKGNAISRSELYERFFQNIARGKHERDKDKHPAIAEASTKLRDHLIGKDLLDRRAQESDAMLWLMSRVAWEAVRLEQRGLFANTESEALAKRHIENLLYDELKFRSGDNAAVDSVRVGLLLTLQANLHSHNASQILFGHKSFREFLVARYWADRLKALSRDTSKRDAIEKALLGASLLASHEDKSFDFLMGMLNAAPKRDWPPGQPFGLSPQEKEMLFHWAEERFQDERLMRTESPSTRLRDDLSPFLRQTALAIGSHLYSDKGLAARDAYTLRSLFTWFWLLDHLLLIKAPRVALIGAFLSRLDLSQADLGGADLSAANLSDANLYDADLALANLSSADLSGANLSGANLYSANLYGAFLENAYLGGADLHLADLRDATLSGAYLQGANLRDANLCGTDLRPVNLTDVNLEGARYNARTKWEKISIRRLPAPSLRKDRSRMDEPLSAISLPRGLCSPLCIALCLLVLVLVLVPLPARAAPIEADSRLSVLEPVPVSEHYSSAHGRGFKLTFKRLPSEPLLAHLTVADARAFVEALEAVFQVHKSRSGIPSLARFPAGVVTAGTVLVPPANTLSSPLASRIRADYEELYGPASIPLPASLESSRWFLALKLSPRYMDEGVREAAVELLSSPTVAYSLAMSMMLYMMAWAAPEPVFSKALAAAVTIGLLMTYTAAELYTVGRACLDLYREAEAAQTLEQLEAVAERFGKAIGGIGLRVLVTVAGAKLARSLPEVPKGGMWGRFSPPRFAFVGGNAQGGLSLGSGSRAQVTVADGTVVLMGMSANTTAQAATSAAVLARTTGACRDEANKGDAPGHHIATNKNDLSAGNGGPWTPRFEVLFDRAGMSMNDPANIVFLVGHQGPHPEEYHEEVYKRLEAALGRCRAKAECRARLVEEFDGIAATLCKPGSKLHKLVTKTP